MWSAKCINVIYVGNGQTEPGTQGERQEDRHSPMGRQRQPDGNTSVPRQEG